MKKEDRLCRLSSSVMVNSDLDQSSNYCQRIILLGALGVYSPWPQKERMNRREKNEIFFMSSLNAHYGYVHVVG